MKKGKQSGKANWKGRRSSLDFTLKYIHIYHYDKTEAEEAEKVVSEVNKGETKERPKAEGEY